MPRRRGSQINEGELRSSAGGSASALRVGVSDRLSNGGRLQAGAQQSL